MSSVGLAEGVFLVFARVREGVLVFVAFAGVEALKIFFDEDKDAFGGGFGGREADVVAVDPVVSDGAWDVDRHCVFEVVCENFGGLVILGDAV